MSFQSLKILFTSTNHNSNFLKKQKQLFSELLWLGWSQAQFFL